MRNGSAAGDGSGGRTPERRRKGNRGLSPESAGTVLNDSLRRPGEKEAGKRLLPLFCACFSLLFRRMIWYSVSGIHRFLCTI